MKKQNWNIRDFPNDEITRFISFYAKENNILVGELLAKIIDTWIVLKKDELKPFISMFYETQSHIPTKEDTKNVK